MIKKNGLTPRGRQYVHMATDVDMANQVGKRRDDKPVILSIKALDAYNDGVKFYRGNDKVWLADNIKSDYIIFSD